MFSGNTRNHRCQPAFVGNGRETGSINFSGFLKTLLHFLPTMIRGNRDKSLGFGFTPDFRLILVYLGRKSYSPARFENYRQ